MDKKTIEELNELLSYNILRSGKPKKPAPEPERQVPIRRVCSIHGMGLEDGRCDACNAEYGG